MYSDIIEFKESDFFVNNGTLTNNSVEGGVTFTPVDTTSYIEFEADAYAIKIRASKNSRGYFRAYVNGRPIAYEYTYSAANQKENEFYLRLNGTATIRIEADMRGSGDYGIDLIGYTLISDNPFRIGDLDDWINSLLNKYYYGDIKNSNVYYGRMLCSLYQRGIITGQKAVDEISRLADYQLIMQDDNTKRFINNSVFNNGVALHFVYMAYETLGDERYRQACIDCIDTNFVNPGGWARYSKHPMLFQTTDGSDSVVYNHNYFLGEALVYIGKSESNQDYIDLGVSQFLGSSDLLDSNGKRGHSSTNSNEYRVYRYQEAFQSLRTGYATDNEQLIADGKKMLNYAENMDDESPPGWLVQNRLIDSEKVYIEVFHENVSCVALPYYYMLANGDNDRQTLQWLDSKVYVENAFTLYDDEEEMFWFSRNYHTDFYTPGTAHSICWYLESGLYDDLEINKNTGAVTFGALEPVAEEVEEAESEKIRVYGRNGKVFEAVLESEKPDEEHISLLTNNGIRYIKLVSPEIERASNIKIQTTNGTRAFALV